MVYQWEIASKWLLSPQVETLEKLTGKDGQKKDGKNGHAARTLELWFFCEFRYVHFSIHVLHELTNFFRKLFHDDESDVEEVKRKLSVCWLSGFKFFLTCTTRNKRRCCHDLVIWDISCLSGSTDVPSLKRFHTISRMVSRVAADAVAGVLPSSIQNFHWKRPSSGRVCIILLLVAAGIVASAWLLEFSSAAPG